MAKRNPKVMAMVEAEIKKNADISNEKLFEKAKGIDKTVAKLSPRQFNATYPLQVKRAMAPKRPRKRRSRKKKAAREDVQKVLLALAKDVAGAQKGEVVDVVAGIDKYVDRVMKAAG